MFKKILIANRGEIACRIIRTARKMGIKTVAVYSDADAGGVHVAAADEAVRIGPAPSAQSYLKADAIIKAAKDTGSEAIHPGFGFLSENADFVRAVEAAGITFIGPDAEAIAAMGDKITSKNIAAKAGVSTIPGTEDAVADIDAAARHAKSIGYPVMIKASAGGGGKGMRSAGDEAELREAMPQAVSEAEASFGDGRVFVEKLITNPRHIEIQILADAHGNVVHLGERECSLQRRHQKVFEEAPSPFIDDKTRNAMGAQAVALAKAVNYRSAGTVEFVVGSKRDFYFLEMNTRLQVEHPVTEEVYGIDLVEAMIRIAAGEKLKLKQADIKPQCHAVEARVYAEDPARGFLPSIGTLARYAEPEGAGIRVDSGIAEGGEISMFYDPMIAKLIGTGKTRDAALNNLARALDCYVIEGVGHNRQFLRHVTDNPRFRKGDMTTGFIAGEYPDGYKPVPPADEKNLGRMRAFAVMIVAERAKRMAEMGGGVFGGEFSVFDTAGHAEAVIVFGDEVMVKIGKDEFAFNNLPNQAGRLYVENDSGKAAAIQYRRQINNVHVMMGAHALTMRVLPARVAAAQNHMPEKVEGAASGVITAPMPGLLARLLVAKGDRVNAGDDIAVIEAMKMENLLKAEAGGVVAEVLAAEGDTLAVDMPILRLGDDGD